MLVRRQGLESNKINHPTNLVQTLFRHHSGRDPLRGLDPIWTPSGCKGVVALDGLDHAERGVNEEEVDRVRPPGNEIPSAQAECI